MIEPRQVAAGVVGGVDWQSAVSGLCRCPGESLHTHKTNKKDCRVCVDGVPTIYCFHTSCAPALAEANKRLRRELGTPWTLTLPDGQVLRAGDVVQASGRILPREIVIAKAKAEGRHLGEQLVLETLVAMAERDPEDQFRTWLKLWPAHSTVWIGDVYSSGLPKHATHFRPVAEWYQIGPAMGNYTCGAAFKPGTYSRSNENIEGQRFLVVESDSLSKDQIGAVFAYMNNRLRYNLHAIIDTAGKSLHGWFDAPLNKTMENRLKAALTAFGCDPKLFTYSQPVRVPGAWRDGKLQRIVWLKS